MNRRLTADSRLETFRKEAKRWLKALRAQDEGAHARLRRSCPTAAAQPGLRDVQHALAREHGLENWAALKAALAENALAHKNPDEQLAEFLEHARLRHGIRPDTAKWDRTYNDHPSRWKYAARILQRHPGLANGNIHAAAVSGDLAEVERILKARPSAGSERAALDGQQPLEYVCYGRLPLAAAADNAVAIAKALLNAGAPCQHPLPDDDQAHFQPLTGVIGGGESIQPPHPTAEALATLLIEHGADPYDAQALYGNSLGADEVFWLDFLYERSAQRGETHKWTQPSSRWPESGMMDFLLMMAVQRNHLQRARWVLMRGANARCRHPYYSPGNLHTTAIVNGHSAMADLLLEFGAVADELSAKEAFQAACVALDRSAATALATRHPEFLLDAAPLMLAARRDRRDMAELLLDLGMSVDVADHTNLRPLHEAAAHDSIHVGALLIERGAEIDAVETRFGGTPLSWAIYFEHPRMTEMLGAVSRNPHALVQMGHTTRLRQLFAEQPELAKLANENGSLFFDLPQDEDLALAVAELLIASGTDPRVTDRKGTTAIAHAEMHGLDAVADLLESLHAAR